MREETASFRRNKLRNNTVLAARFAPGPGALPRVRVELGSLADYDVLLTAPTSTAAAAPAGDGP